MRSRAVVVADAAEDVGLGHLARSSAVAGALAERGIETDCVAYQAPAPLTREGITWRPESRADEVLRLAAGAPVVLLDSYRVSGAKAAAIAARSALVVMLDSGEPPEGAALVIAPSRTEDAPPGYRSGLRYACLSRQFRAPPIRDCTRPVEDVLVTTGGGDPGHNAGELAHTVATALPDARVRLVRGPHASVTTKGNVEVCGPFESLADPLAQADIVVTGAGGTLLEACASGAPAIGVVLAENQAPLAAALAGAGAVRLAHAGAGIETEVRELAGDPELRRRLSLAGRRAVDGHGAERVATELERLMAT